MSPRRARQRGFGLVEMMIAMVLALLLVAAAVQVFLSARASQQYNQALSEIQDSARYAMHTLTHDLRLAGYTGCPATRSNAPSVARGSPYGTVNVIADAANAAGITQANLLADSLTDPDAELPDSADSGSDAIRLAYMRDYGVRVVDPAATLDANLKIGGNPGGWEREDVLLVTDCSQADLFAATSVSQDTGGNPWVNVAHAEDMNSANNLSKIYEPGARVLEPYAAVYYVRQDDDGLYRREYFAETDNSVDSTELVPGVTDLTVRHGVDTNGDRTPDVYRTTAQVEGNGEWPEVVAVRVGFIVSSQTPIGNDADGDPLSVLDESVDPPDDGRLRQVFSTTIALRNRVP